MYTSILDYEYYSMYRIADQREELELMLDRDRERYRREDREILLKMAEQGIR